MDLLKEAAAIFVNAKNFYETKNYYFERHNCKDCGEDIKIMLDFMLSNETTDKLLKFGYCENCKTLFYHNDFTSKRF